MGFSQLSPLSGGLTIRIHEFKHVFNDLRGRIHVPTSECPLAAHSYGRRENCFFSDDQFDWLEFALGLQLGHRHWWLESGLWFVFRE